MDNFERHRNKLLKEKLYSDIPRKVYWDYNGNSTPWYYCESFDHLLAVAGYGEFIVIEKANDLIYPLWVGINITGNNWGTIITTQDLKDEIKVITDFMKELEREKESNEI
jgi:hypothetical protein